MTDKDCAIAREVHALLTSAFPHAGDINLAKAADLVSLATETKIRGDDDDGAKECTLLAIQKAIRAIEEGSGAAESEGLLLGAVRSVEQWVRSACE